MAITFGTVGTFTNQNNATVSPPLPVTAVIRAGNLILARAYARGSGVLGAPSGYGTVYNVQYTNSATSTDAVFYKVAAGAGETSPVITYTGGSAGDDVVAEVVVVSGADPITPIGQVGATSANGSAANIGPVTGLTIGANNAVVFCGARRDDWTSVAALATSGGFTYTEISDVAISTAGNDAGMVWDYSVNGGSPAATGNKTFTVTGGSANPGGGVAFEINVQTNFPFTRSVAASTDDASLMAFTGYQETDTAMLVGSVGAAAVANSGEGWRFPNVTTPRNSTVNVAYIQMVKSGAENISVFNRWVVILEDDTAAFSSGSPPGARPISTNIAAGDDGGDMAADSVRDMPNTTARQTTFAAALTELFARPGWNPGQAVGIGNNLKNDAGQETGFARANFKTWDEGSHTNGAVLVIFATPPPSNITRRATPMARQAVKRASYW